MSPTDTRTRLLETALQLIWSSNYNAVGVNEICKQAEITKGSFYHHFESKAELFCQAAEYYWDKTRQELDSLFSPLNSPLEQLEGCIRLIFNNKIGDDADNIPGCAFFSAGSECGGDTRINDTLMCMLERGRKYNVALLRHLEDGGFIAPAQDLDQIARLMQQFVQGLTGHTRLTRNLKTARQDLACGLYRIIGLKAEFWRSEI